MFYKLNTVPWESAYGVSPCTRILITHMLTYACASALSALNNGVKKSHNSKQKGFRIVVQTLAHCGTALYLKMSLCQARIEVELTNRVPQGEERG